MLDLFAAAELSGDLQKMAEGAVLLRGAALPFWKDVLSALTDITARSPFRRMITPGGFTMSVAMTNCGVAGWVTDRTGYRYDRKDPETGPLLAADARLFLGTCRRLGVPGGLPRLSSRRVPDQSL
jgi:DNA oxidative demethylase